MPAPSAWMTADVISNCNTAVRAVVAVRHKTTSKGTFLVTTPLPPVGSCIQQTNRTGTDYKCIQYWHLCVTIDVSQEFQHHNSHYNTLQLMQVCIYPISTAYFQWPVHKFQVNRPVCTKIPHFYGWVLFKYSTMLTRIHDNIYITVNGESTARTFQSTL